MVCTMTSMLIVCDGSCVELLIMYTVDLEWNHSWESDGQDTF